MEATRTLTDKVILVVKGIAMGAANKVPGVSGGVVAFVAGFYEEFIYSLQKFNTKAVLLIVNGRFKSFLQYINYRFISLLVLGMVISYFSVSKILDYLIIKFEIYVWATFFGMILGSIYYLSKDFDLKSKSQIVFMSLGAIGGLMISLLEPATQNDNLWFVLLCGFVSVSGMTLPGLSGSFLLILMGNYVLLLVDSVNALYDTITEIFRWDFSFTDNAQRVHLLKILGVFTAGSVLGLVSISHVLGYVLKHFRNNTFATIIGFITGSLGVVWPWKEKIFDKNSAGEILLDSNQEPIIKNYKRYWPDFDLSSTYMAIFFILVGISIILFLVWYDKRNKTKRYA
ncbi:DUF368 domain-containing protein [Mesohalobacter halotolerans]|uniref:DUF368 domain-containing protein n=1 Tax=Mesohalobacter halotolerans TaxID=1883405 RepID=A0A4V6ALF7_9FLAO|nr:DUF368 domain-containing protein [Mesohalobacter halotolerans]MBS3737652.1 DUF368 domain-containing protein [Psychroflexus sp.]TKS56585.1 DUF368 domain-containing protein [Mesohalobacter halotolerans]